MSRGVLPDFQHPFQGFPKDPLNTLEKRAKITKMPLNPSLLFLFTDSNGIDGEKPVKMSFCFFFFL
jgi:hypothetical protein